MSTPPQVDLDRELGDVNGQLGRADAKASTLLSLAGAGLALLVSLAGLHHGGVIGQIALDVAGGATAAAVALLLSVIRPRLGPHGFPAHATIPASGDLLDHLHVTATPTERAAELRFLSRLAVTKYRRIRYATDLLTVAGLLLAVAVAT